jgi:succinate dehydrogenase / fumarate reductase cytochrome b subunit
VNRLARFWKSTVGKKVVMAITGLIMVGFLIGHMAGNLQVFVSAARLNAYAAFLHSLGEVLWMIRGVLVLALVLHIVAAVQLILIDRAARPVAYAKHERPASTFASRTMRWGGLALAIFIVLHLMHFTTGTLRPAPFVPGDVYRNVVDSFRIWWVSALYIAAMIAVGLHLYHGTWSVFRTLGISPASAHPLAHRISLAIAFIVWLGFTIVPVGILLGWAR